MPFKSLITVLAFSVAIFAAPVSFEKASQVAENAAKSKKLNLKHKSFKKRGAKSGKQMYAPTPDAAAVAEDALLYVFQNDEDKGFVIVSGDDVFSPIIGISDKGVYNPANLPPNFAWYIGNIEREMEFALENGQAQTQDIKDEWVLYAAGGAYAVGEYLVKTQWNQDAPYWNKTPTITYTGCVATAMAQIMNYHKYPASTIGTIPAYTSRGGLSVSALPPVAFDWDNMLDKYEYGYDYYAKWNEVQGQAVATLMNAAGRSVKMNYGTDGSSAYSLDVPVALKTYFGYEDKIQYINRDQNPALDWIKLLKEQIDGGLPVYYAGNDGIDNFGHAFVLDGYNVSNNFHINWGWGGNSDGFYAITVNSSSGLNPSNSSNGPYSYNQSAVIDIEPKDNYNVDDATYINKNGVTLTAKNVAVIDAENIGTIGNLNGWYLVRGNLTRNATLRVSGEAHIILEDGSDLKVTGNFSGNAGINVSAGNSLAIYSQSTGNNMGKLTATGGSSGAGIGGGGTVTIIGGTVKAIGGSNGGAGISGVTFTLDGSAIVFASSISATGANRILKSGILFIFDIGTVISGVIFKGTPVAEHFPESMAATWEFLGGKNGIAYANGGNEGFIEIPNVSVANDVTVIDSGNIATIDNLNGWYLVRGNLTRSATLRVSGEAHIILEDGCDLRVTGSYGINVSEGNSLSIYAQSTGNNMGKLTATGGNIGIGYNSGDGTVTINGGTVTATGGIYSRTFTLDGNATVFASSISATGENRILKSGTLFIFNIGTGIIFKGTPIAEHFPAEGVTAAWEFLGGKSGIAYAIDGSEGFLEVPSVSVIERNLKNNVPYIDENGKARTANSVAVLDAGNIATIDNLSGWLLVRGNLKRSTTLRISGEAHIILEDGSDLAVTGGINVSEGNSLSIYAQSTGNNMGKLTARGSSGAGIGGGGTVTIAGGTVTATGGNGGAGIGGGYNGSGGTVTINGGTVTATGGDGGAGIGRGYIGSGGTVTINGGTVMATGGIGGGGGTVTINGGTVTATGGIGGGETVTINGGTVTATGGIVGDVTINGGTVTATGSIYSRTFTLDRNGTVTINGGTVTATGSIYSRTFTLDGNATVFASSISATGENRILKSGTLFIFNIGTGIIFKGTPIAEHFPAEGVTAAWEFLGGKSGIAYAIDGSEGFLEVPSVSVIDNDSKNEDNVPYISEDGEPKAKDGVTVLDAGNIAAMDNLSGWYLVRGNLTRSATLRVLGEAHIILEDGCDLMVTGSLNLMVTGSLNNAGINVSEGNSLSIYAQSTGNNMGKLTAIGGFSGGAGIGGGLYSSGGTVTIAGGTVTAIGNGSGAGIGDYSGSGTVTISGGTVTATGGNGGAGIGGSESGSGTVTISGGTVTATGGIYSRTFTLDGNATVFASSINATGENRILKSGTLFIFNIGTGIIFKGTPIAEHFPAEGVTAAWEFLGGKSGIAYAIDGSEGFLEVPSVSVIDNDSKNEDNVPYISEDGEPKTKNDVAVLNAGNIAAIDNLSGWLLVRGNLTRNATLRISGEAHIILEDGSSLRVTEVNVSEGSSLSIYAQSAGNNMGKLTATGGNYGIGIGGGSGSSGGTVTINGGTVTATGSGGGAGIGGGGSGGTVTINGGTVTATGSGGGAGIGGGGTVTIIGGTVKAIGGSNGGAGISGGTFTLDGNAIVFASSISATGANRILKSGTLFIFNIGTGIIFKGTPIAEHFPAEGTAVWEFLGGKSGIAYAIDGSEGFLEVPSVSVIERNLKNNVPYISEDGEPKAKDGVAMLDAGNIAAIDNLSGWFLVRGNLTRSATLRVLGEAHIILEDGSSLAVTGGINVSTGNSLSIYAQSTGNNMGKLTATGGIGSGGTVTATGGNSGDGTVTINGGTVTATGGIYSRTFTLDGNATVFASSISATGENRILKSGTLFIFNIGTGIIFKGTPIAEHFPAEGVTAAWEFLGGKSGIAYAIDGSEGFLEVPSVSVIERNLKNNVPYISEDGEPKAKDGVAMLDAGNIAAIDNLSGWFLVRGNLTRSATLRVLGEVHIILEDGSSLAVNNAGINVSEGNSLSIYAQSAGNNMGKLTATGDGSGAGIGGGNSSGGTVTINGGTVTATGGNGGAGIGSGESGSGGTVTINGGTVTAIGSGAGIGGGERGSGGTVTINGGTVTATGGYHGAGIGGGYNSSGVTVTINGGTVTATGGNSGAGIGGGESGSGVTVTITGGTVTATGGYYGIYSRTFTLDGNAAVFASSVSATGVRRTFADGIIFIVNIGTATILKGTPVEAHFPAKGVTATWVEHGGKSGIAYENGNNKGFIEVPGVTLVEHNSIDNVPYIDENGETQIANGVIVLDENNITVIDHLGGWFLVRGNLTRNTTLWISSEAHIILEDGSDLRVTLTGTTNNAGINAGINVSEGNSLSIYAQSTGNNMGMLTATGGSGEGIGGGGTVTIGGAGIGGGNGGTVTIAGGTVTAIGNGSGAGIGGGSGGSGGTVTITGGTVTATGGNSGAGIGGGSGGSGGTVTIAGGTVTATGGNRGAGIGGGYNGSGGTVTIAGGTVTATGGSGSSYRGAGIGGGYDGSGGTVTINGGTVTATGGGIGAGIGGGSNGGSTGTVTINGGTVTATGGGYYGAGIGGYNSSGGTVTINGGTVTATGGNGDAGIGGGDGTVTINGGTVTATGGIYSRTFTLDGNAVVFASSVSATGAGRTLASGILFTGKSGNVYGSTKLQKDLEVESDYTLTISENATLTIPSGITLTNNGKITPANGSKIIINGTIGGENKIDGANTFPSVTSKTLTSIMLGGTADLLANTNQEVEYAISQTDDVPASGWQTEATFANLTENTTYWIFARSKGDTHFATGTFSAGLQVSTEALPACEVGYKRNESGECELTPTIPQLAKDNPLTPTRNGVTLTSKTNATISVYNLSGKLISRQNYNAGNHSISFSYLPKGVYIIQAQFSSTGVARNAPTTLHLTIH